MFNQLKEEKGTVVATVQAKRHSALPIGQPKSQRISHQSHRIGIPGVHCSGGFGHVQCLVHRKFSHKNKLIQQVVGNLLRVVAKGTLQQCSNQLANETKGIQLIFGKVVALIVPSNAMQENSSSLQSEGSRQNNRRLLGESIFMYFLAQFSRAVPASIILHKRKQTLGIVPLFDRLIVCAVRCHIVFIVHSLAEIAANSTLGEDRAQQCRCGALAAKHLGREHHHPETLRRPD